jgi:sarcosine oxidase
MAASDVIVVGLGAMGAAVCHQLAVRGVTVVGVDRFEPPHPYGSTHGDTRITRLAIAEGAQYAPLVRRSLQLWRELEQLGDAQLLTRCGALFLGRSSSAFVRLSAESARLHGIDHELLDGAAVADRFPMFAVDEATRAYFEPGGGYLRPERAVAVQLELARRAGAYLRLGERVSNWSASAHGASVSTDRGTLNAERLVVCAGPWIIDLLPELRELFKVYRQQLYWFEIRTGYEQLREMPVFIWDLDRPHDAAAHPPCVYGFPAIDGPRGGVKVATESYQHEAVPDGAQHPASQAEAEDMYRTYVASTLPWLGPAHLRSASCLYTCTRSGHFVIDHHPEHERVTVVSACSGHGFKHSAAIGEAVAELLTEGRSRLDLGPFSLTEATGVPARQAN